MLKDDAAEGHGLTIQRRRERPRLQLVDQVLEDVKFSGEEDGDM